MTNERFTVDHQSEQTRYVLIDRGEDGGGDKVIGEESYLDMPNGDRTDRILFHTEVSKEYGGQGLASTLVRATVEQSIASGHKVVPVCPYVVKWLAKHEEYAEHVVKATPAHLQALSAQG